MKNREDRTNTTTTGERGREALIRALAIIGLIAILVIGLWAGIQVIRFIPQVVSAAAVTLTSIFQPAERIVINAPDEVVPHAEIFTLSWKHVNKDEDVAGIYSLSYSCRSGFHFEAPREDGTFVRTFCDTPFNFTGAVDEIRLIPVSTENRFLDVPITVTFTPDDTDGDTIASEVTLTIENSVITGSPDTTNGGNATSTNNGGGSGQGSGGGGQTSGPRTTETRIISGGSRISDPNGRVDLAATVIETGRLEGTANVFVATSSVQTNQRAAVRFQIENLGTKQSGQFIFNVVLPTKTLHIFTSKTQPSLFPGDRIEYVIGFDKIKSGPVEILTINVDPTNSINEVSESNNIVKTNIQVIPFP